MARIVYQHHEDTTRELLQASLQTRELGYVDAGGYQELIILTEGGQYRHFPSLERLDDSDSLAPGALLVGFYPGTAGMSATNVQAAIEELKAAGTGGTLSGTGTAGTIPIWSSTTAQGNSILSQVSSKLLFSGDTTANLYLDSVSTLKTDGTLVVGSTFTVLGGSATFEGLATIKKQLNLASTFVYNGSAADQAYALLLTPSLTKNNSNTRQFYGAKVLVELNSGGSNANTTIDLFSVDTINTSVVGVTTNLARLLYGGSEKFKVNSAGSISNSGDISAGGDGFFTGGMFPKYVSAGLSNNVTVPTNNFNHNAFVATFQRNTTGAVNHSLLAAYAILDAGGSNASETLNLISCDTLNVGTTGVTVNMLRLSYGGTEKFKVTSNGDITILRRIYSSELTDLTGVVVPNGSGYLQTSSVYAKLVGGNLGLGALYTDAKLYINSADAGADTADIEFDTSLDTPTPTAAMVTVKMYYKNNKVIFVVNDGGTVRYKYLDLTGTGITWVHSTSAP